MYKICTDFSNVATKPYYTILQPRRDIRETPAQQLQNWMDRHIDMTSSSVSYHAIDGNPVDVARNYLISKALEDNPKYILFVDEDTVLPYDAVVKFKKTSNLYPNAIISGIYYVKFGGVMVSVLDEEGRYMIPDADPNTGLIRNVISTGLGCAFIPIHIIKGIMERFPDIPLFCVVNEKTWGDENIRFMGEDTWFYNLSTLCGYEIIADTSVHCLHMELATGKYAAHPDVNLENYLTNIPVTTPLELTDRPRVSRDYNDRICRPNYKGE